MSKEKKQKFAFAGFWTFLFVLSIFGVLGLGQSYVSGRNDIGFVSSAFAQSTCGDGMVPVCGNQCKPGGFSTMEAYKKLYLQTYHNQAPRCFEDTKTGEYVKRSISNTWSGFTKADGSCLAWSPVTVDTRGNHFSHDHPSICSVMIKTRVISTNRGICEEAVFTSSEVDVTSDPTIKTNSDGRIYLETVNCTKTTTYPAPAPCRSKNVPAVTKVTYDPPSCAPSPSPSPSDSPSPSPSESPSDDGSNS